MDFNSWRCNNTTVAQWHALLVKVIDLGIQNSERAKGMYDALMSYLNILKDLLTIWLDSNPIANHPENMSVSKTLKILFQNFL